MNNTRIISLDVFRGLTIVLMIMVNSQNLQSYPLLQHAPWDGFTFADLVFPSFLFIVGLTLVISFKKYALTADRAFLYRAIFKRSLILFLLGLALNLVPYFNLYNLRYCGVLQRIAVCYLLISFLYLNTQWKTQVVIFASIILGYWFLILYVPVPHANAAPLSMQGSWVAYVDQFFFSALRLRGKPYDPEGILSSVPALASTLLGSLVGQLLLSSQSFRKKLVQMLGLAFLLLASGWFLSFIFPINKNLWSSSFVLWAGGWSLLLFALCFLVVDIWGFKRWAWPFIIFGMNALFAFVVHVLFLKIQFAWMVGPGLNLKDFITAHLFGFVSSANAVLSYSLAFLIFNFLLVWCLYSRKIFIRL